jgi:uncharacterized protein
MNPFDVRSPPRLEAPARRRPPAPAARPRLAEVAEKILHVHDTPPRTAAAFALGVFLSFSPFLGFQIAAGLTAAFLLRLNRAAVIVGLCANLPWLVIPWYTITTVIGAFLLGTPLAPEVGDQLAALSALSIFQPDFWWRSAELVQPFFWAFLVGSTLGATLVALLAYPLTLGLLRRRRKSRAVDRGR